MSNRQGIFGTNAEHMCMYVRTFFQSEFVITQFLEDLGTILTKNQGLIREWLLIPARLDTHEFLVEFSLWIGYFWENFENGKKFWANAQQARLFLFALSHVDVSGVACTAVVNAQCTFAHSFAKRISGFSWLMKGRCVWCVLSLMSCTIGS